MPKRKRDDNDGGGDVVAVSKGSAPARHRKRVEEKLFHGTKILHRALKLAKGFERQKLGRRHKAAVQSKDEATIARLDAEIEALKILNLPAIAEVHLYRTLLKDKVMSQSSMLPPKVSASAKPAQDTATANVTARLYNSHPVKEAIMEVLASIRPIFELQYPVRSSKTGLSAEQGKPASNELQGAVGRSPTVEDEQSAMFESEDDQKEGIEVEQGDEEVADTTSLVSGSDNSTEDDDFAAFDSRIASSEEDYPPDPDDGLQTVPNIQLSGSKPSGSNRSPSASPSPSSSPQPHPRVPVPSKRSLASPPRATSAFLPSLTMGGYWSGSESGSEAIADLSDNDVAPRKNRRGQRARQQIWEKKYGSKAKHVQDGSKGAPANGRDSRDDGWDLKRGAQQGGASSGRRNHSDWKTSRGVGKGGAKDVASGGNATEVVPRAGRKEKTDNSSKPLHPSWEAAKRAKEKKVETGSFAGKKIVFN